MSDLILEKIAAAIRSIRYGAVEIVIHDGRVVQIEKTEKLRVTHADQIPGSLPFRPPITHQTAGG